MPTSRQIGRLYSLGRALGLDHDATRALLTERYHVASSKNLSTYQYEEFTRDLQRQVHAAAVGRGLAPEDAQPRFGSYSSFDQLAAYAESVLTTGRAWPGQMTLTDAELLALLLDKFRLYRSRDRRLSQKQLDDFVADAGRYQPWVFRSAAEIYLGGHTDKPEKYFLGICQHVVADRNRELAAQQRDLQLV